MSLLRLTLIGAALLATATLVSACAGFSPDIPFPTLEARYANAQSRFADLPDGVRMHYRDQGVPTGETIVLIHGFSASLADWEPWVQRLGSRYRVISLDLPGHGLTRAPADYVPDRERYASDVEALLDRLGVTTYVVAGNSMGGGVAFTLAIDHPDRVRGLILVDSVGWPGDGRKREGSPLVFKLLSNPVGRALLRHADTSSLAERGLRQAFVDPALVTPDLVRRYVDLSRAPGHRSILLNGRAGPEEGLDARLRTIRAPTLVLHGEADALIPVAGGRWLADTIPGARLVTYPGVGHVPMEQIPDRSAEDLRSFLEALPETGEGRRG